MIDEIFQDTITFVNMWQQEYNDYMHKHFPNNPREVLEIMTGKKYHKIVWNDKEGPKAVAGFVDQQTGDIFMAASWSRPAAHARGNVTSDEHGFEALDLGTLPHIRYLR